MTSPDSPIIVKRGDILRFESQHSPTTLHGIVSSVLSKDPETFYKFFSTTEVPNALITIYWAILPGGCDKQGEYPGRYVDKVLGSARFLPVLIDESKDLAHDRLYTTDCTVISADIKIIPESELPENTVWSYSNLLHLLGRLDSQ